MITSLIVKCRRNYQKTTTNNINIAQKSTQIAHLIPLQPLFKLLIERFVARINLHALCRHDDTDKRVLSLLIFLFISSNHKPRSSEKSRKKFSMLMRRRIRVNWKSIFFWITKQFAFFFISSDAHSWSEYFFPTIGNRQTSFDERRRWGMFFYSFDVFVC